jgi:predicted amidohydrolase YtcJ
MCRSCVSPAFTDIFADVLPTRREFVIGSAALLSLLAAGGRRARAAEMPEIILRNAVFVTMAGPQSDAQAMAIKGSRIVAIGREADVMARKTATTQVVDLGGRTVLPGFIDPHIHPIGAAITGSFFLACGPDTYKDKAPLIAALKTAAAAKKPGEWVYACDFDNLLQGGELTVQELDSASTTVPIFVLYNNSHTASVNSAALAAGNVTKSTPDKPGGGHFERTVTGELTGVAYETNMDYFYGGLKVTPAGIAAAMQQFLKRCASTGMTALHEAGSGVPGRTDDLLGGYQRLAEASSTPVRLSSSPLIDQLDEGNAFATKFGKPGAAAVQVPGSLLSFYAVKITADGSNQTKTAAQTTPYLNTADKGILNFTSAELVSKCQKAKSLGWPISIHANGDATIDLTLDAIEEVYGANPATGINRIEHCTMARSDQIQRMKKLGVQPSFLMNHVYYYGGAYRDVLFGDDRAARMDPAGQCVALGLPFTLHSDAPVTKPGPLQLIGTAVTRRCSTDGTIVGEQQAVSVDEALKAMTIYAAAQIGMAQRIGSLEVGKDADLVVLADDPRKTAPERIESIAVTETWVAGRRIG